MQAEGTRPDPDQPQPQQPGEASASAAAAAATDAIDRCCSHCGRTSKRWRRHRETRQLLCGSCFRYCESCGHLPDDSWLRQRLELAAEPKRCTHCGADRPDATRNSWLRHPQSRQRLCAACWQHSYKHGGELPDVEARQQRRQQRQEEKRCTHCGNSESVGWYRHPATKQRLCNSCGLHQRNHGELPSRARLRQRQERRRLAWGTDQGQPRRPRQQQGGQRRWQDDEGSDGQQEGTEQQAHERRGRHAGRKRLQQQGAEDSEEQEEEEEAEQRRREQALQPGGRQGWRSAVPQPDDWEPGTSEDEEEEETDTADEEEEEEEAGTEEEDEEEQQRRRQRGRQHRHAQQQRPRRRWGQPPDRELRCTHCGAGSDISGGWRRMPGTQQRICTPCWHQQKASDGQLPPLEWVQKSLQPRQQKLLEAQQGERQCGHCGAGGPSDWSRHPATQLLLCTSCSRHSRKHGGQLPDLEAKQRRAEEPLVCTHCGTSSSISWRRHPTTKQRLCKDCGGYTDRHDGELPDLEARRLAQQERSCHHCGASHTSGNWKRVGPGQFRCTACRCYERLKGQLPSADLLLKRLEREQRRQQQQHQQQQQPVGGGRQRKCAHCGCTSAYQWRRHPSNPQQHLCTACRQYHDSTKGALPSHAVLQQRAWVPERQQRRRQEQAQQAQQAQQAPQQTQHLTPARQRKRKQAAPGRVAAVVAVGAPPGKRQRRQLV